MSNPREWTITRNLLLSDAIRDKDDYRPNDVETIRVIEYSAYEQATERTAEVIRNNIDKQNKLQYQKDFAWTNYELVLKQRDVIIEELNKLKNLLKEAKAVLDNHTGTWDEYSEYTNDDVIDMITKIDKKLNES